MNTISFRHACFVELEARHLEVRLAHAACFRSQRHRTYMQPDFIRALATVRGVQMNKPAAEAFEVARIIVDGDA
jgi:hypothetical protein